MTQRKFKGTDLHAECTSCRKAPAWAHYPRRGIHLFSLLTGLGLLTFYPYIALMQCFDPNLYLPYVIAVASVLVLLSFPLYWVLCLFRDRKIQQLTDEQMPHFSL